MKKRNSTLVSLDFRGFLEPARDCGRAYIRGLSLASRRAIVRASRILNSTTAETTQKLALFAQSIDVKLFGIQLLHKSSDCLLNYCKNSLVDVYNLLVNPHEYPLSQRFSSRRKVYSIRKTYSCELIMDCQFHESFALGSKKFRGVSLFPPPRVTQHGRSNHRNTIDLNNSRTKTFKMFQIVEVYKLLYAAGANRCSLKIWRFKIKPSLSSTSKSGLVFRVRANRCRHFSAWSRMAKSRYMQARLFVTAICRIFQCLDRASWSIRCWTLLYMSNAVVSSNWPRSPSLVPSRLQQMARLNQTAQAKPQGQTRSTLGGGLTRSARRNRNGAHPSHDGEDVDLTQPQEEQSTQWKRYVELLEGSIWTWFATPFIVISDDMDINSKAFTKLPACSSSTASLLRLMARRFIYYLERRFTGMNARLRFLQRGGKIMCHSVIENCVLGNGESDISFSECEGKC